MPEGLPILLELSPGSDVPELDARRIEEGLYMRLLRGKCGYRLVRERDEAALILGVMVDRWREVESPGGAPRVDPATGRSMTGTVFDVEVGFEARVVRPGGGEPLAERRRSIRRSGSTMRNPLWDPRERSVAAAYDAVARELDKLTCRVVRKEKKRGKASTR